MRPCVAMRCLHPSSQGLLPAGPAAAGASDEEDQRLWLARGVASNYGACIDLFAPGRNILSASSTDDSASE